MWVVPPAPKPLKLDDRNDAILATLDSHVPKSMKDVVHDHDLTNCFRLFSLGEMAGENFLFWESAQSFSVVEGEEERRGEFETIYETHLKKDCKLEINLSGLFWGWLGLEYRLLT